MGRRGVFYGPRKRPGPKPRAYTEQELREKFAERLSANTDTSGGPDACWLWRKHTVGGYGRFRISGKEYTTHRAALEVALGRKLILFALHRCDNPPCVNPAHLYEGTRQQNNDDKLSRGRDKIGELGGRARLTGQQAAEIFLAMRAAKKGTARELAAKYGVCKALIYDIHVGRKWRRALASVRMEAAQ